MWSILAKIAGALFSYAASQNPNGGMINKATSGFKQLSNKLFDSDSVNGQFHQNYVKGDKND